MQLPNRLQKIIRVTLVLPTIGARVYSLLMMEIYIYISFFTQDGYMYVYIYISLLKMDICIYILINNEENLQP